MVSRVVAEDVARILSAPLPWHRLFGKTILISGAGGFLPAYLVETVARLNDSRQGAPCRIVALVRNVERAAIRLGHLVGRDDFVLLKHDIVDPLALDGPADFIIHAASQASPRFYLTDPVGTLTANVAGTMNLLNLAREKACEGFLFFSSGEVYGEPPRVPIAETDYGYLDPATVRGCYGEGKRVGETMCVAWAHQFGVPTRIVRPFHTYGPGIDHLNDGRVFADFVADIIAKRDLVLKSDGLTRRAFCYIADATQGFFTVLLTGENGTPYNVGNENAEVSIRELAQILVEQAFPEAGLRLVIDAARQDVNYARSPISRNSPDTSRIRALGWSPSTGIVDGFRRTVASLIEG